MYYEQVAYINADYSSVDTVLIYLLAGSSSAVTRDTPIGTWV